LERGALEKQGEFPFSKRKGALKKSLLNFKREDKGEGLEALGAVKRKTIVRENEERFLGSIIERKAQKDTLLGVRF